MSLEIRTQRSISVAGIADEAALHERIGAGLKFPDDWGRNFDALWDCLTGFAQLPDRLVVEGLHELIDNLPEAAEKLRRCIDDFAKQEDIACEIFTAHRACPCCGAMTLTDPVPGSYELCPVCQWEDDPIQGRDPDYEGGANSPSLRQAQANVAAFGFSERQLVERRVDRDAWVRDPRWSPLEPVDS